MASCDIKVSIVIPVYNGGENLIRMLDSVLRQSVFNFEVICVDDGSSDGVTPRILEEYVRKDPRMRCLHQTNQGPAAARNYGVEQSAGKYVYVCDQDDWLHPQLLEYCLWVVETRNVDFVAFRYGYCSSGHSPDIKLFEDFNKVPCLVSGPETHGAELRKAHIFHTDCWVQFMTRELAMAFRFSVDRGMSRPFSLIRIAKRWAVSEAVLYYYNSQVETSLMHQIISEKVLCASSSDRNAFYGIYAEERAARDPDRIWEQQCRKFLLQGLKIEYNMLRRSRKREQIDIHRRKMEIFTEALKNLFLEKKIPMRWVKLRYRIIYRMLIYKDALSRRYRRVRYGK